MPIWLIELVVSIVFSVASSLIKQADQSQQQQSGLRDQYSTGGVVPQSFVVGTLGLAGKLEYENTWGESGQTPNAYLSRVISLGDLPISALTGLFVDAERQTVATTGHVAQGYPVTGSKAGNVWVEFFDGTQSSASSFLTSQFSGDADRPWETDMVGVGVPYIIATALWDEKVWSGFPSYLAEVQGIKLYDPRHDTTAGGSGAQRRADPSTWVFTDNPAVVIYNILIGIRYAGDWVWGMQDDIDPARLPYAAWAAAMNACDESVTLNAGGTEKRFRVGREISFNEKPSDVIAELLVACNGRISEAAGVYSIVVGAPGDAGGSFSDADVIVTEQATLDPFPNLSEIVNGATGTYLEPGTAWTQKDAEPYYNSDLEAEDDGRQQLTSLSLNAVFSGTQAQRILQATVLDGRRFYKHAIVLRPLYGVFEPLDVLSWTSAKNQYSDKSFLVISTEEGPNGNVIVGLQEIDSSDHDWTPSTDERAYTLAALTPIRPPPQLMSGWSAAPASFDDDDGVSRHPSIEVSYAGGQADVQTVRVQVRLTSSAALVFDGTIPYDPAEISPSRVLNGTFLSNTAYQVRGKFLPFSGRITRWSNEDVDGIEGAWLDVTTPVVDSTLDDASVTLAKFGADARALIADLGAQARSALELFNQAIENSLDVDGGQWTANNEVLTKVTAQVGSATSSVTQLIQSLAGPDSALALSVTSLETQITDPTTGLTAVNTVVSGLTSQVSDIDGQLTASNTAITDLQTTLGYQSSQATMLIATGYTPAVGWTSRIGFQARVVGNTLQNAGLYIEATSSASRVVIQASQFAVLDDSGNAAALFDSSGATIKAARIGTLTAANMSAGIINASSLIATNVIVTGHLQDASATYVDYAANSGNPFLSIDIADTSIHDMLTLTYTPVNGKTAVTATVYWYYNTAAGGSNYEHCHIWLEKDGTSVADSYTNSSTTEPSFLQYTFNYVDTAPGTTSSTYKLRVQNYDHGTGAQSVHFSFAFMKLENIKK